jgi:DNA ligase-1
MTAFKPLLAETCEDISKLRYPVYSSPKLDGIRCVKLGGKALSRKLKPIPNDFVRAWVEANLPDGVDGELMLRDVMPGTPNQDVEVEEGTVSMSAFSRVSSAIMSKTGEPDFVFQAFDYFGSCDDSLTFDDRYGLLRDIAHEIDHRNMGRTFQVVPHVLHSDEASLRQQVALHQAMGYEGTMVRDPNGRYKFGRSTLKEGILLKIKAFADEEAMVIGVVEQMHNENEATRDALGNVKRSSAKAGKVGNGKLGALVCVTMDGVEFEIGTGFTDAQRKDWWSPTWALNRVVKFKHQPPPGGRKPGEAPRFPVFLGWRED